MIEKANNYIDNNKKEILESISNSVKVPSVTGSPEALKLLDDVLLMAQNDGFKTAKTKSGRAGHIEIGDCSNGYIGILAHLDVVPANASEWSKDPYSGEIDDKYIHGRGTQDDKGPFFMTYWAMKSLLANGHEVKTGVRFILGTQEEGGEWSDVEEYFEEFGKPMRGFTPDGDFPLTYAEKGILRVKISGTIDNQDGFNIKGGTVVNAVPSSVMINDTEFTGVAGHAKDANEIESASQKAFEWLANNAKSEELKQLGEILGNDPLGKKVGIDVTTDDEGPLTVNIGLVDIKSSGEVDVMLDIRYPIATNEENIVNGYKKAFENSNLNVEVKRSSAPLYVDKDSEFIKTLENAYRSVTGDNDTPLLTTGGGTYARMFENCVAFGYIMPNEEPLFHMKDEKVLIENVIKATKVYAKAIYDLTK